MLRDSKWEKLWELDSSLGAAKTAVHANQISSNTAARRSGLIMTFIRMEDPHRVALLKPWSLSRSKTDQTQFSSLGSFKLV